MRLPHYRQLSEMQDHADLLSELVLKPPKGLSPFVHKFLQMYSEAKQALDNGFGATTARDRALRSTEMKKILERHERYLAKLRLLSLGRTIREDGGSIVMALIVETLSVAVFQTYLTVKLLAVLVTLTLITALYYYIFYSYLFRAESRQTDALALRGNLL